MRIQINENINHPEVAIKERERKIKQSHWRRIQDQILAVHFCK